MRYICKITAAFFMFVALASCANDAIDDRVVTPATSSVVTSTIKEVIYPKVIPATELKAYNESIITTFNWTPATYSGPSVTIKYKVERYLLEVIENPDGTTTTNDVSYFIGSTDGLTLDYTGRNLRTALLSKEKLNLKIENTLVFRVTSYTGDDVSPRRNDNLVRSVNFVSLLVKPAL